jgi:SAM-dependent methyltransferase
VLDVRSCPACRTEGGVLCYAVDGVPVHSCLLLDSAEEAVRFPRGELAVVLCEHCGLIANRAFEPSLTAYSARYEDSQAFSPTFVRYADWLARRWVERHGLAGGHVLEIGCGKGDFTRALVAAGVGTATGIDPTLDMDRIGDDADGRISWVQARFEHDYGRLDADAVVFRHVLEHLGNPSRFLADLRAALDHAPRTPVLVEVPDARRILDEGAFWDVYYEHAAYLVADTVRELFEGAGFRVAEVEQAYDGQYLLVTTFPDATPRLSAIGPDELAGLRAGVERFRQAVPTVVVRWREELQRRSDKEQRVVVWGSGSKATAFLVAMGPLAGEVDVVVDVNPHKWGRFVAGTGHRIVGPDDLLGAEPDLVIVMNPVYRAEIEAQLRELGLGSDVTEV